MANILTRVKSGIQKASMVRVGRTVPAPRKGGDLLSSIMDSVASAGRDMGQGKRERPKILDFKTIETLAHSDPLVFAIMQSRRDQIKLSEWDVVPDVDEILSELDEWKEVSLIQLKPFASDLITPRFFRLSKEIFEIGQTQINRVLRDKTPTVDKKTNINILFDVLERRVKDEAVNISIPIRDLLKKPSDDYTGLKPLLLRVVDDILLYDAGVIVKNNNSAGNKLAEIYDIPGEELVVCRNADRSIPKPPDTAFVWNNKQEDIAEFTRDEIVYFVNNMQPHFYGFAPIEVMAYVITTSLYADQYNIEFFKNSNIPPMIINLGKDVRPENRVAFQRFWNQEIGRRGAIHRVMFVSGTEKMDSIPLTMGTNKDMQMYEYLKWSTSIKCACFQLSPQDVGFTQDLHRTTAEVQYKITKDRGLRSILTLFEDGLNDGIVKPMDKAGMVKFKWLGLDTVDNSLQTDIDNADINNGIISRNQRRRRLGLRPIRGGDVILVPGPQGNMIPIESLEDYKEQMEITGDIEESQTTEEQAGPEEKPDKNNKSVRSSAREVAGTSSPKRSAPSSSRKQPPSNKKEKGNNKKEGKKTKVTSEKKIKKVLDDVRRESGGDSLVKISYIKKQDPYFTDYNYPARPMMGGPLRPMRYPYSQRGLGPLDEEEKPVQAAIRRSVVRGIAEGVTEGKDKEEFDPTAQELERVIESAGAGESNWLTRAIIGIVGVLGIPVASKYGVRMGRKGVARIAHLTLKALLRKYPSVRRVIAGKPVRKKNLISAILMSLAGKHHYLGKYTTAYEIRKIEEELENG